MGLTTLPLACADCLDILRTLTFWNPQGLSRLVMGLVFFFFAKVGPVARSLWLFLSPHSPGDLGEVTGDWRKLHKEELRDFYSLPNNIFVIRSRKMRSAGHVAYNVSAGKPEGKRQIAKPKHKIEDNVKNDYEQMENEGVKWVNVVGCCEHFQKCKEFLTYLRSCWLQKRDLDPWSQSHSLFVCLLVNSVHVFYLFLMLYITKKVGLCSNISDFYCSGLRFETLPQC
jgi:hypothetical protein